MKQEGEAHAPPNPALTSWQAAEMSMYSLFTAEAAASVRANSHSFQTISMWHMPIPLCIGERLNLLNRAIFPKMGMRLYTHGC